MNEGGKSYDFRQKVTIKNVTFSGGQSYFSSHKIVLFLLPLIFF